MSSLLEIQRRFAGALLEPLSGENRALADLPAGAPSPSTDFHRTADDLLRSTDAVHARERLELYHRQYWWRLLDSLAEDFGRVRDLLGADAFVAALERYLVARPPSAWTLRRLGADLADSLRADPSLPAALRPWAAALAEFEYAHMKVFEAARLPVPDDAALFTSPLTLQPDLAVVAVDRPISRLLSGQLAPADLAAAAPRRRELHIVWRSPAHALRSRREPLSLLPLLKRLQAGGPLADIIAGTRPLPRADLIEAAFARWRELGWVALASHASSPA
jgi:hypothetical protein